MPARLAGDRRTRSEERRELRLDTEIALAEGVPRVDVLLQLENTASDHRLRLLFPLGAQVAAWFDRQDWLRARDEAGLLDARYRAAPGLQLRQEATIGDEGWAVDRQVLVMPHGLRWSEEIDLLVLALVSGCDGRLPLRDQLAVLAVAHDVLEADLAEAAVPIVAHLVERGVIEPAG